MKRVFFLFILLEIAQTKAQDANVHQFSDWQIGARAGFSLLPDFEDQFQKNFKIGIEGGISTSYHLNKYFALKTELNFTQKGKSYSYTETQSLLSSFKEVLGLVIDTSTIGSLQGYVDDRIYSTYQGYHKLSYIEIPILAEASLNKFKFTAGPYVGFLVKSYTKESLDQNIPLLDLISPLIDSLGLSAFIVNGIINTSFPGYNQTSISESTSSSIFTKFNYGFLFQISYQIHPHIFLEARYSRSLNSYLIYESKNIHLSNFTLSLAYNFGLKK